MPAAKANGTSKKPAAAVKQQVKSKSIPKVTDLSAEKIVDSSSDDDSSDSELDEHDQQMMDNAAKVTNGDAAATTTDSSEASSNESSEEDSDSEEEEEVSTPGPTKSTAPTKVNGLKRKAAEEKESIEDEEESDHKSKKAKVTAVAPTPSATASQAPNMRAITTQEYVPPRGYKKTAVTGTSAFTPADLNGKVVWHISAPAGVPITSLSSISQADIGSGKSVLNHNGTDYVLVESTSVEATVLLPGNDGYKAAGQQVTKSYALQPAFTLPTIPAIAASRNAGSSAAANIALAAVTAIRPQPKGLRMRYKPPGFGKDKPGKIGDGSDEEDEDESIYQFPRAVGLSTDGDGTMLGDGVAKKKKKDKKAKHEKELNGIVPHEEPQALEVKKSAALDEATAEAFNDADEAARRKAEKKAKKAKRKAEQS